MRVVGCGARGRSRYLLILRFTPRGTCRPRLLTTRSSRISSSTAQCRARLARGGKCGEQRQLAADDAHGVREGEVVGGLVRFQGRFVHEPAHGEMRQQQAPELLPDQLRGLAAEHDPRPAQLRLQFGKRTFDFPALVVERGQFCGGRLCRIGGRGHQPIERLPPPAPPPPPPAPPPPSTRYSTTRPRTPAWRCRRSLSLG